MTFKEMLKKRHNNLRTKKPSLYFFLSFVANAKKTISYPRYTDDLQPAVDAYAKVKKDVSFIQIGSNDGISNDPLHALIQKHSWRGILVEPIPFLFKQLRENYTNKSENLHFENCAVGAKDGQSEIYKISEDYRDKVSPTCFQLASFNKNVILAHSKYEPIINEAIVSQPVEVATIGTLLKRHGISNLDLIHIDTEGYDFEIIKTINFNKIHPDLLLFESRHLNEKDYKACLKKLRNLGYKIVCSDFDTLCVRPAFAIILNSLKRFPFYYRSPSLIFSRFSGH